MGHLKISILTSLTLEQCLLLVCLLFVILSQVSFLIPDMGVKILKTKKVKGDVPKSQQNIIFGLKIKKNLLDES